MNWEAFFVIGIGAVVLGILLYSMAMLYLKIVGGDASPRVQTIGLNKLGWSLVILLLMLMFLGFSTSYLAPNSFVGRMLGDSINRFIYASALVALFFLIEKILLCLGMSLGSLKSAKGGKVVARGRFQ